MLPFGPFILIATFQTKRKREDHRIVSSLFLYKIERFSLFLRARFITLTTVPPGIGALTFRFRTVGFHRRTVFIARFFLRAIGTSTSLAVFLACAICRTRFHTLCIALSAFRFRTIGFCRTSLIGLTAALRFHTFGLACTFLCRSLCHNRYTCHRCDGKSCHNKQSFHFHSD